jgi:hypothetical protein
VALKAAANARPGQPADVILDTARIFEGFLSRPLGEEQAGASESSASDSAPAESSAPEANTGEASGSPEPPSTGADRDGGVGLGEGPAPSSTKKGSWEERWAGIEVE